MARRVYYTAIGGLFGAIYSGGMRASAAEADRIMGCSGVYDCNSFFPVSGVVPRITNNCILHAKMGEAIVLNGHSYGGFAAGEVARNLAAVKIKTDVLMYTDTTVDTPLVPDTLGGKVIEYYQDVDIMGRGHPNALDPRKTPIIRHLEHVNHVAMASLADMHKDALDHIRALLKTYGWHL